LCPDPDVPADRRPTVSAHGDHDLPCRGGLPGADTHANPGARHLVFPSTPTRARKPAVALAQTALRTGAALVSAPAARPHGSLGGPSRGCTARLHVARQGVPPRAGRGRPLAPREVSGRDLARGRSALRARRPGTIAQVPRGARRSFPAWGA